MNRRSVASTSLRRLGRHRCLPRPAVARWAVQGTWSRVASPGRCVPGQPGWRVGLWAGDVPQHRRGSRPGRAGILAVPAATVPSVAAGTARMPARAWPGTSPMLQRVASPQSDPPTGLTRYSTDQEKRPATRQTGTDGDQAAAGWCWRRSACSRPGSGSRVGWLMTTHARVGCGRSTGSRCGAAVNPDVVGPGSEVNRLADEAPPARRGGLGAQAPRSAWPVASCQSMSEDNGAG